MVTLLQKSRKHPHLLGILYGIFENDVNYQIILKM